MKSALIHPNYPDVWVPLVVDVVEIGNEISVALPLYWVECPDEVLAYEYRYDDGVFTPYIIPRAAPDPEPEAKKE